MEPRDYITLASVIVAPLAALAGVWLERVLTERERAESRAESERRAAATAVAPMFGILVDVQPELVLEGRSLRVQHAQGEHPWAVFTVDARA